MGLRGPAPKPTAQRKLEGVPGHRPLNPREPMPDATMPRCPAWLRKEAKDEWGRVAKRLHRAGILTNVDRAALAAYCQAWARWRQAEELVEKSGQVLKSKAGNLYVNPCLGAASMALKDVTKLAAQLGMTPSGRSRIATAPAEAPEQSLADLLFEGANVED